MFLNVGTIIKNKGLTFLTQIFLQNVKDQPPI